MVSASASLMLFVLDFLLDIRQLSSVASLDLLPIVLFAVVFLVVFRVPCVVWG